ncbi:histone-lysine N-methyltransferase 2E-like isoform X2 [Mizuhopecten yessoensis]|uniref:histone-lysine N-methyltransferase 2E-like isoform X2 n=1 Tax=Mizuhopecten yessoensis TaxID=6573 RepID=UPI000B45A5D1|nr:histone-lysine N-methyltransferase 2E-like isoform X2 [Mizuhopecten yessoensis]
MSVVLRLGVVHTNDGGQKDVANDTDVVDCPTGEYYMIPQTYPGCFGLPYQDHNYGAPPPPTPPPSPPPQPPSPPQVDKGLQLEVEDVVMVPAVAATEVAREISVEDDSITRCICDYTHDDGYMICCDKCSVWQHIDCMGVDRSNIPESYFCEICEPRVLDRERARQLQTKRKELLINDSSATDTDPEEAMNRQMSQQLMNTKKGKNRKKTRVRSDRNNPTTPNKNDVKLRRPKKDKKDINIKKEKENKEADKKQKQTAIKEAISKKINKSKLNKKPGLTLVMNENAQDPWDSSYSPWVDKYEEAIENQYSPDIQALMAIRINGQPADDLHPLSGKLQSKLCHVTDVNKNRKGLEASETIGEGEPIIEYTGKVTLKQQFDKDNFFKQFNPFALFYNKYDNIELCVDATSYGSTARFIRRSCKANAEVRHIMDKGVANFFIYSAKVIPRGSEITIPYDYNYKDCSYCVECACLRNNCPVAKHFKRKQNAQNKKDKSLPRTPVKPIAKSPVKSPVKSPTKSPLKSSIKKMMEVVVKKEVVVEELPPKAPIEVPPPPVEVEKEIVEPNTDPVVEEKEEPEQASAEQTSSEQTSAEAPAPPIVSDVGSDSEDVSSGTPAEKRNKISKTREERKMDAIMKAFEKLEKREERRKEALARLEHHRHDSTSDNANTSAECTGEEIKEEKVTKPEIDVEKDSKELARENVSEKEIEETDKVEPVKRESKPKSRKAKKAASRRKSRINTGSSRGSDIEMLSAPVTPSPPVQAPVVTNTRKSRTSSCTLEAISQNVTASSMATNTLPSRKRRFSSNCNSTENVVQQAVPISIMNNMLQMRRGRMSSSCSSDTTSQDESSNTLPSCPSTPAIQTADLATPPSFKFLKTKKHLMSEWLSEKTQDTNPLCLKTEPLEVAVEDNAMFVTCLPSPRNSMDHLRRNSHSSGSARAGLDNSIGSAKKRWLRQAMWDKPGPDSGSMSPVATSGGASPNPAVSTPNILPSIPSPGASPPGDFVTPLKKRRFARESCDQPIPQTPSTPATCSSVGLDYNVSVEAEDSVEQGKPDYHPTPAVIEEEEDESTAVSKEAESDTIHKSTRGRDSIDSETCDSIDRTSSRRNSIDLGDSGLEKSPETDIHEKSSETEHENSFETKVTEKCSESEFHETGSNVKQISDNAADENDIEDRTSGSKTIDLAVAELSVTCNIASDSASNSKTHVGSDKSMEVKGAEPMESECDSIQEQRNLADSDMELRQQDVESELEEGEINDGSIEESMQVDSTEDSANMGDVGGGKSAQDNKLALCDSTSKVDENKMLQPRMLETVQADCGSSSNVVVTHSVVASEVKEAAVVDSSTDTDQSVGRRPSDSDRVAILLADQSTDSDYGSSRTDLLNSSNQEVEPSHQSEESLVESVSDFSESVRHSSSSSVVSLDTSGEKVGSSSDEKTQSCLSDVSSSSERRNLASSDSVQSVVSSQTVDDFRRSFASSDSASSVVSSVIPSSVSPVVSSQSSDNVGVSSTELVCASDATSNMVGNSDTADSSEAAVSSKMDKSEVYSEDSLPSVTGSMCLPNTSEADTPSLDDFGVMSDEVENNGEASSSSSISEDSHLASSSVPSDPPPPTKKKVSLLEYRKRLKEKSTPSGSCPLSSSSSSSSQASSSYTSYPSTSPSSLSPSFMPSPSMSSSYNKPSSSTTSRGSSSLHNSRRLPSLPSLPLFDSSPPKDSSRYHFKSSSDLVRRKSTEVKKPAKPLSLTERLKLEFGFDDTEEEAQKEKNDGNIRRIIATTIVSTTRAASSASSSFTTPPPPPPPPPSRTTSRSAVPTSGQEYTDQGQEAQQQQVAPSQQGIAHQPPPHHPGFQQPMYHPQPHTGQPPLHPPLQPDMAMHGGPHPAQPAHIMGQNSAMLNGPAPGMMPPHTMVGPGHILPPVPNGQGLGQAPGMLPPHSHIAGVQAAPPPMQNGPGPAPPGGPSPRQGGKIPSLMSIQTFPSRDLQPTVNSNGPPASHSPQPQVFPGQHLQQSTDQGLGIAQHVILNNEVTSYSQPALQQQHPHTASHTTGYQQSPQGPGQPGFNSTINGPQGPNQTGFNSTINGPQGPNQTGFNSNINGPQGPNQTGFNSTMNGNSNFNMIQSSPLQVQQQQPPANGPPLVHEYNHGYNGMSNNDHKQHFQRSPSQYNSQGSVQRKSKYFGKKKKKGHNHQQQVYPDSGGLY